MLLFSNKTMQNIQANPSFDMQPLKLQQKLVEKVISWFFIKILVVLVVAILCIIPCYAAISGTYTTLNHVSLIIVLATAFAVLKVSVDIQEKYYTEIVGQPAELLAEHKNFPQLYSELYVTLHRLAGRSGTYMLRSALYHLQGKRQLDLENARGETYNVIMEQSLLGLVQFESKGANEYIFDTFRPKVRAARLPHLAQKYISLCWAHLILKNPCVFDEEYLNEVHPGLSALVSTMTSLEYSHEDIITNAEILVNSIGSLSHEVEDLPDNFA